MYEPLHHKYRPQTFSQLVGQDAIAQTLTHALEQKRIAPAYLFCGPRGTGKTSSARILAKSLNCLSSEVPTAQPCGQCDVCQAVIQGIALDVVEIDAASNTGVDNIRELIERSQFAPVQCRYKLYVLDEVHMLSTAAFNALLKTLEEPPSRVVFVLATTDPQRVLPTIISRCQRFDFRRIPLPSMIKHLSYISAEEAIQIEPSAIQLVAQISQGGLRDAESLLDQLSLQANKITVETVWDLVGAVPERDLLNLVRAIAADDSTALLERVRHLMDKGREPLIVLQSLVGFYRDLLIAKRAPKRVDLVAITSPTWAEMIPFAQKLSAAALLASQQKLQSAEVQIKNTTQPRLWLEITLTGLLPSALEVMAKRTPASNAATNPATNRANSAAVDNARETTAATDITSSVKPKIAPSITPPIVKPAIASTIQHPVPPSVDQPAQTAATGASKSPTEPPVSLPAIPGEPNEPKAELSDSSASSNNLDPAKAAVLSDPSAASATQPTPLKPAAPEKPIAVAFGNLSDLWKQILAVLQPRGTQMLMSQQGMLLGFDGVGAKVGFRSAPLQKAARERIPNLEAAFQTVFQRPIKISLEVVDTSKPVDPAAQSSASSSTGLSPHSQPSTLQRNQPTNPPTNQPGNQSNGQSTNNSYLEISSGADIELSDSSNISVPNVHKPVTQLSTPSNPRLDASVNRQLADQEQEKIKRFASFFNGQIVNLDDDADPPLPGSTEQTDSNQGPKSSAPGPDVPF
ncbi:DNA polymerase III, subunits gamma and tau, putative [Synechococcus sp. PCC 7335]|uniref:DNA polymerase III subunit gamma/tau n=1 Tax=Synechococcus sp. (strain ATCC 29403 / PCC 7335) TaxID=91464 RepID=UPI00017EC7B9|nr:DNA polymerase III subunit gamma/tau [Synechococcus sp. PCC 7335]EDX84010.1 DNA polymerase III, subunits gamma and tau, putative [Synechococcus sp. PCC 7335]